MFDWFTFLAQIANFLILVFLLKRFLYEPITRAMDERENTLKLNYENAKQESEKARQLRLEYESELESFDQLKKEKINEIEEEIDLQRKSMIQDAEKEVKELKNIYRQSFEKEKEQIHYDFRNEIQKDILNIVKKILLELADQDLEEKIVRKLMLEFTDNGDLLRLTSSGSNGYEIIIRTSMALRKEFQKELSNDLTAALKNDVEVKFQESEKNIIGVEMVINGQKASWSVDQYLSTLDDKFFRSY